MIDIVKYEFIDTIIEGDEVNGRKHNAMLFGAMLWPISRLEDTLKVYESILNK